MSVKYWGRELIEAGRDTAQREFSERRRSLSAESEKVLLRQ